MDKETAKQEVEKIVKKFLSIPKSELDETISYLKSMKRMLNKIGFKTGI